MNDPPPLAKRRRLYSRETIKQRRQRRRLSSNWRAMKAAIRHSERRFAEVLSSPASDLTTPEFCREIACSLDYFLTWRLKLIRGLPSYWTDGVADAEVTRLGPRTYQIVGKAWLSQGAAAGKWYCDVKGKLKTANRGDRLQWYYFDIEGAGQHLVAKKAI